MTVVAVGPRWFGLGSERCSDNVNSTSTNVTEGPAGQKQQSHNGATGEVERLKRTGCRRSRSSSDRFNNRPRQGHIRHRIIISAFVSITTPEVLKVRPRFGSQSRNSRSSRRLTSADQASAPQNPRHQARHPPWHLVFGALAVRQAAPLLSRQVPATSRQPPAIAPPAPFGLLRVSAAESGPPERPLTPQMRLCLYVGRRAPNPNTSSAGWSHGRGESTSACLAPRPSPA